MNKTLNQRKICAVVVTYNRKDLLKDTLEGLKNQSRKLDAVYLVDNASTDGTPKELKKWGYINDLPPENLTEPWERHFKNSMGNFVYVRNNVNNGGSGGFYEGIKRAHQSKKFDWIWVMDDDVVPDKKCLSELEKVVISHSNIAGIGCSRYYFGGELAREDCKTLNLSNPMRGMLLDIISEDDLRKDYFPIASLPFEGLMFPDKAVDMIGLPDKRFFIFGDDTDYCIRLSRMGEIIYASNAKLKRQIIPKKAVSQISWKSFYIYRNYFYLELRHGTAIYKSVALIKKIIAILVNIFKPKVMMLRSKAFFAAIIMLGDSDL